MASYSYGSITALTNEVKWKRTMRTCYKLEKVVINFDKLLTYFSYIVRSQNITKCVYGFLSK